MKRQTMQLIPNEETLFNNLIHYENLIKHLEYRYWLTYEEAKRLADYLRRGLV